MDLNMHRSGMFAKLIQIDTTTVAQHKGKLENNIMCCTEGPRLVRFQLVHSELKIALNSVNP